MNRQHTVKRKMDSILGLLNLHNTGRLFLVLMRDRRVPVLLKVSAVSGLIYIFSPLDVIPRNFTGVGLVDDTILALVMVQTFIETVPPEIVDEYCEKMNIDPKRIFVNVPQMVRDAMEMVGEGGPAGWQQQRGPYGPPPPYGYGPYYGYPPQGQYPPPQGPYPPSQEPPPPPPYSRYSAFSDEEEQQ